MYKHHQESIQKLIDYFKDDQDVLAIILGGSVAKGCERIDSDIDAMVVVTDEKYIELSKQNRLSECILGYCTYDKGYFDIKYYTKDFLQAASLRGSEPTRNAFVQAKCIFSSDTEIETIVSKIGVFQVSEKATKMHSFYSAFSLYYGFFWNESKDNTYLRVRTASDIVLYGYRLLLQENEILFPCQKGLIRAISSLEKKPENIIVKGDRLLTELSDEAMKDFIHSILSYIKYIPSKDWSEILTRFVDDNELWWYKDKPAIAEW